MSSVEMTFSLGPQHLLFRDLSALCHFFFISLPDGHPQGHVRVLSPDIEHSRRGVWERFVHLGRRWRRGSMLETVLMQIDALFQSPNGRVTLLHLS
jgi:hypothetical protein